MRMFLLNAMIPTFQTDILTFPTNFFLSDSFMMDLEFRGQKVWVFLLLPSEPKTNKHYCDAEITEQMNPG